MAGNRIAWIHFFTLSLFLFVPQLFSQNCSTFDSLSQALIRVNNPIERIEVLLALSSEVVGNQPREAAKYAEEAYGISIRQNLTKETIHSLMQMGKCLIRISDYQKAVESIEKAIEIASEQKLSIELARAKGIMALIYYELGDYEKSARCDFENLAFYEQINDQKEIGVVLGNIGIDFTSQNNYQKGLEYLKKSFDIAVKLNDYHGMAYQYNNIAGIYSEYYKDYKIALRYYKEALEINLKLSDKQQEGIYLMNIGNCFSSLNEYDSVLKYYENANDIFIDLNNQLLFAECQTLLGSYHLEKNNLAQSLIHADTALYIGLKFNYKEKVEAAAALLHRIYLCRKDTINAYKYAMIENEAKDSLLILQNKKEVYKLEFQYNYEKLDKTRKISQQKKENLLVIIILSLILAMVTILFFYYRHRLRAKNVALEKQVIEKELQFKDKELTINLISLIKKNEMLSEISNKMVEIGKGAKKDETKEAIDKISRELRNSTDDKMLKEFSLRFQEVHRGFYEALQHRFPDLTQSELKLCAFLRLNMTTKEISELTRQRVLTIDHARYRLRKKLGISNSETNLVTFLSQIEPV